MALCGAQWERTLACVLHGLLACQGGRASESEASNAQTRLVGATGSVPQSAGRLHQFQGQKAAAFRHASACCTRASRRLLQREGWCMPAIRMPAVGAAKPGKACIPGSILLQRLLVVRLCC